MRSFEPKITVKPRLRPCFVDGKRALFHRWVDHANVVDESLLRGGHPGGQLWTVFGIVEFEDGTVKETYPSKIQFVPNADFAECSWGTEEG